MLVPPCASNRFDWMPRGYEAQIGVEIWLAFTVYGQVSTFSASHALIRD